MEDLHTGLKSLGVSADHNAKLYDDAQSGDPADVLERFPNPASMRERNPNDIDLGVNISTSEFTSLCPMTGQPDFATIKIHYRPDKWCVESKAIKLYFLAYRNRRDFHEACVNKICNDLVTLLDPFELTVTGEFTPRGGIPLWPTARYIRK